MNKVTLLCSSAATICLISAFSFTSKGPNHSNSKVKTKRITLTYCKDIAPIIYSKCYSCHRPSEAAPFTLKTYEDVQQRGDFIAQVTEKRYMPPWKPAPTSVHYQGDESLTQDQIDKIQTWVKEGMVKGDEASLPKLPQFSGTWSLGQPDLIVKMPKPFTVPADGPDVYRNFVIPLHLKKDEYLAAIDFRPSARTVVHHSLFYYDSSGYAESIDGQDGQPGFGGLMGIEQVALHAAGSGGALSFMTFGSSGSPTSGSKFGNLGGWAVGAQPRILPDGLAYYLPKSSDLILSTHFHPNGMKETEQSTVGLYFAKKPPANEFTALLLPPIFGFLSGIDIPAGDKNYQLLDSYTLPVGTNAVGVSAHAHYLGKHMQLTAILPDGKSIDLLDITDWDFNWQGQYQFAHSINLPAGTKLNSLITYDNSATNPRQPSSPPKEVRWGEQTTDEMGSLILVVVPKNHADMKKLDDDYFAHVRDTYLRNVTTKR